MLIIISMYFAGCTHEGTLYVSGGYKGPFRGHLNQMFKYDTDSKTWVERAPLIYARSYHAMTSLQGRILVAGGVNYIGDDSFEDIIVSLFAVYYEYYIYYML